ncbi:MAG: GNAT family N-acetyltransferase [Actinobacteria bacterium]|nr:GNAT family N-acetyltransferase [Actinomycetota bacterium]MCG2817639.1 GNAT family N-acetyltransferase [Actinomycetes bacterium]MBU4179401.1 GNAT family N-acetyltransferase [Actinomycetota bacterium]MBU4218909.1 GNAT family N-acetyltransferase [Actinomycetota bacterium]MBU4358509.1 GNAT family N-acetyltransferase [Actinomycetota bacterium]
MIEGDTVILRPMTPGDVDMFLDWVNDLAASPFWYGKDRPLTREELLGDWESYYFDGSAPEKGRGFIIEAESQPVGMVAYADVSYDIDRRPVRAEIDIVIGGSHQGRGYGVGAMRALISYLFDGRGFHRIDVHTYEHNTRMRHLLEKLGFTMEGVSRQAAWVDGEFVDEMNYGLLSGEPGGSKRR